MQHQRRDLDSLRSPTRAPVRREAAAEPGNAFLQAGGGGPQRDGLGFSRGSGADDRDLYAPNVLSTAAFLSAPGTERAYAPTSPTAVGGLGERKARWIAAIQQAGGTREECAVMLAQLMQETFTGTGYDASKDGRTDGSRNFSNLNLNEDMLFNFGGLGERFRGDRARLNQDEGMVQVAKAALTVIRTLGTERYLHFTRGGRTGLVSPSPDDRRFAASVREVAKRLAREDAACTDDTRIAHQIHHR